MAKKKQHRVSPFTFGVWYLMINFPLIVFVKSGITGSSPAKRAKAVDRDAPGVPIPLFFVPTIGHHALEKWSHRAFSALSVRYYKGDGHTEWFWLPAAIPIIGVMCLLWFSYLWALAFVICGDSGDATACVVKAIRIILNLTAL